MEEVSTRLHRVSDELRASPSLSRVSDDLNKSTEACPASGKPNTSINPLPFGAHQNANTGCRRVVLSAQLPEYGIPYSRVHIDRLVKAGQFPAPFKLSANRNAWWESEILDLLESRAATRGSVDDARSAQAQRAAAASVASRTGR